MLKKIPALLIVLCSFTHLQAQFDCGHAHFLQSQLSDTLLAARHAQADNAAVHHFREKSNKVSHEKGGAVLTIPVVVHILHQNGPENIPNAQVLQAIQWLNDGFARSGPYINGEGVDTEIRFCLATRDPMSAATNGILRVESPQTTLDLAQDIVAKSQSYWPSKNYLNIWVVREICWPSVGCNVAAYASPPGFHGSTNDGIVIEHSFFGTNTERTAALLHEAGHYLGLYHTFEGGCSNTDCLVQGDRVCDTPPDQSTARIPCDQQINTCSTDAQSGLTNDLPDDTHNFMDYGNLACFQKFTAGQSARMRFFLEKQRASLLQSKGCLAPCPVETTAAFLPQDTLIFAGTSLTFENKSQNAANISWSIEGQPAGTSQVLTRVFSQPGFYTVTLQAFNADPLLCDASTRSRIIQVVCGVEADFRFSPAQPTQGQAVTIENLSKNADNVQWFVNNVAQPAGFNGFTPTQATTYTIRLVAGSAVCTRDVSRSFTLTEACGQALLHRVLNIAGMESAAKAITSLPDGNWLAGGETVPAKDLILVKSTPDGAAVWTRVISADFPLWLHSLSPLDDGGCIVLGRMQQNGVTNAFWARISPAGKVVWQHRATATGESRLVSLIRTADKNWVSSGWIVRTPGERKNAYILKFDSLGRTIWARSCDVGTNAGLKDIREDNNRNLIACGFAEESDQSGTDGLLLRLNPLGGLPRVTIMSTTPDNVYNEECFTSAVPEPSNPFAPASLALYGYVCNVQIPPNSQDTVRNKVGWYVTQQSGVSISQLDTYESSIVVPQQGMQYRKSVGVFTPGTYTHYNIGQAAGFLEGGFISKSAFISGGGNIGVPFLRTSVSENPIVYEDIHLSADNTLLVAGTLQHQGKSAMYWTNFDMSLTRNVCFANDNQAALKITGSKVSEITSDGINAAAPASDSTYTLTLGDVSATLTTPCAQESVCNKEPCKAGWIKRLGFASINGEGITCLSKSRNGTLMSVGYRRDSIVLINSTAEGDILWMRTIRTGRSVVITDALEDTEENWLLSGYFTQNNLSYGILLKYDAGLHVVTWCKTSAVSGRIEQVIDRGKGLPYIVHSTVRRNSATTGSPISVSLIFEADRNQGTPVSGVFNWSPAASSEGSFTKLIWHKDALWGGGNFDGNNYVVMRWNTNGKVDMVRRLQQPVQDFCIAQDTLSILCPDPSLGQRFNLYKMTLEGQQTLSKLYSFWLDKQAKTYRQIEIIEGGDVLITADYRPNNSVTTSLYLMRIGRNGAVRWSKKLEQNGQRLVFYSRELSVVFANTLFLGAEYGTSSDRSFWLARINATSGAIGDETCTQFSTEGLISDNTLYGISTVAPLAEETAVPGAWNDVNAVVREALPGVTEYSCRTECREICDNGLSDGYEDAFDCFNAACKCTNSCEGHRSNIWYFGKNAGLDFSTDPPAILTNGKTNTAGSTSVQCDNQGHLLFYMDSTSVYDRFHNVMPGKAFTLVEGRSVMAWPYNATGGFNLMGSGSSLVFSGVLQMARRSYLGDAFGSSFSLQSSIKFAVHPWLGAQSWVLVKLFNSSGWAAYNMNGGQGLPTTGTLTFSGTPDVNGSEATGQIKFSRDGRRIANTLPGAGGFDYLTFDCVTGSTGPAISVLLPELKNAFGLEFSPDDRYLYVSTYGKPSRVWQFDLEAGNDAAAIANSRVLLAEHPALHGFGYLQLARNGKIYVAMNPEGAGSNALSVIHRPNEAGVQCLFQERAQSLGSGRCYYGLPAFTQKDIGNLPPARVVTADSICGIPAVMQVEIRGAQCHELITLSMEMRGSVTNYLISSPFLSIPVQRSGDAILTVNTGGECPRPSLQKRVHISDGTAPVLTLGPDRTLCATGVTTLQSTPGFVRYRWSDGTTEPTLTTFSPGRYILEAWDACGRSQKDTIEIKIDPGTQPLLGPDRRLCRLAENRFTRPSNFVSWEWSPKSGLSCDTCATLLARPAASTRYVVTTRTANGCLGSDTLVLTPDTLRSTRSQFVCLNTRLPFLNTSLPPDTTAVFSLTSAQGCDSILTVNTFSRDTVLRRVTLRACPGDSVQVAGQFIRTGTTRPVILKSANTCDSTLLVEVLPLPAINLLLPRDTSIKIGDTLTLRARATGGTGALSFSWTPADHLSCVNCRSPLFRATEVAPFTYTLTARDANGCRQSGTVTVTVNDSCLVYYPNVFTPDGDGVNDRFYLLSFPCAQRIVSFTVYNRWGDAVFSRTNAVPNEPSEGWDGTDPSGKAQPTDVFFWMAEVEYYDGRREGFKGEVTLLR